MGPSVLLPKTGEYGRPSGGRGRSVWSLLARSGRQRQFAQRGSGHSGRRVELMRVGGREVELAVEGRTAVAFEPLSRNRLAAVRDRQNVLHRCPKRRGSSRTAQGVPNGVRGRMRRERLSRPVSLQIDRRSPRGRGGHSGLPEQFVVIRPAIRTFGAISRQLARRGGAMSNSFTP